MQIMTCQDFNRYTNKAQSLADREPVIITKYGKPAYILQAYQEDNQKKQPETLAEWFGCANPEVAETNWDVSPRSARQRKQLDWGGE
ncbi:MULTISPECIES: hypothetical protein [Eikenella]|uniref:Antitoxin n=1 Tax=Eikenella longinqua TaxID=1795827 RepID=A0A1A9S281_9NEIS|nr:MULTISPECIES: hypothetical protein [Eikenella]OAM31044.1 hypothetical protein A7P95_00625 [Eikenella longinqua]